MTTPSEGAKTAVPISFAMSRPRCIERSLVYGSVRMPKSDVTQPRAGQIEGVEASKLF